ncbi:MAG: hypothetical protein AAFN81_14860 [Bacteroidota bacterium]
MKTYLLLCLLLLSYIYHIQAQNEPVPRFLIGTEAQLHFADIEYPSGTLGNYGFGLHVEKPIGRMSLGVGILQQQFGWMITRQYTGKYNPPGPDDDGVGTYDYLIQERKTAFWNIPLRIQYRMPCNCVYLQGAIINSFLYTPPSYLRDDFINPMTDTPPESGALSGPARYSIGYELGIGLNFHLSDNWKLYTRLQYTQYTFGEDMRRMDPRRAFGNSYFGLNIGLQRAFY